jgi:hypothetical protein
MGTAGHELLLSGLYFFMFPMGPLITMVGIPLSLKDAQTVYSNEIRCPQRVRDKLGDVPAWVRSTFGGTPVAQLVAEGARSQLREGGPAIVVLQGTGSKEERSAQHERLGKELGAKTLVLADIRVLFGETVGSACDVKLTAQADVRVQPIGQPEMKEPRFWVWAEQPQVPLEEWASEPARARVRAGNSMSFWPPSAESSSRATASEWDARTGHVIGMRRSAVQPVALLCGGA